MKKTTNQFTNKLLSFFVLMSFVFSWLTPLFSNNVLAMSQKFKPTNYKKTTPNKEEIAESMSKMPIQFEENHGQFDKKVRFASKKGNGTLFLTATEAVFTQKINEKKSYALKMELLNANKEAKTFGSEEKVSKTNYFRGNDSSKWQTDVSTFGRANYEEVYQGIDLAWYGNAENELEYDFIVKPNADYQQIQLKFSGAKSLKIDEKGDLLIKTKYGTTTQRKPYTFQTIDGEKREVASRYKLVGKNKVKFVVGEYDKSKELVIDPTLLKYGSFLGGSGQEYPRDMAIDSEGNIYIVGTTQSTDFPVTAGAFDTTLNGTRTNIFISKIKTDGSLDYSSYLAGTTGLVGDSVSAITIDVNGNAYLTGETYSSDFPVTSSSYDTVKDGTATNSDVFVTKINANGSALVFSTFVGGTGSESGTDLVVDLNGNVRVVGRGGNLTFPSSSNAFSTTGSSFYFVLNPNGATLNFSSRIAGTANFYDVSCIFLDTDNNSVLLGNTNSPTFPTTANAFDRTYNGGTNDMFMMKVSPLNSISYSSFLGGSGDDQPFNGSIDGFIDNTGSIYVLAGSSSSDFPKTNGALSRPLTGVETYILKFNSQMNTLLLSTNIGTNSSVIGRSIAIDNSNNIYIWGTTFSGSYASQGSSCSGVNFIAKYSSDGVSLKNITCYPGSEYGSATRMKLDNIGNLYLLSATYYHYFITTPNSIPSSNLNGDDAFITKMKFTSQSVPYDFDADGKSDMAVFRNGMWHVNQSLWNYKAQPFGLATDTPIPADYDGDGKTDFAVWRPSDVSGTPDFYVLKSSTNTLQGASWGTTTDVPVPADYDGDGKTDFAVYRTSSGDGDFFILNQTGTSRHYRFGVSGDKPVVADYDGDGKADFAVFRPSTGTWYLNNSSNDAFQYISWGLSTDKLVPADYDGDGKTDVAVFRDSEGMWYINQSSDGQMKYLQWGLSTDKLVPADYDGDGKTDMAVYRDGQWFIWQSSNNSPNYANVFGNSTDMPVQTLAVK